MGGAPPPSPSTEAQWRIKMQFETEGHEFDLAVQRFIAKRWETDVGTRVRAEVIEGLKSGSDIACILDKHVLDHSDNFDPYGYPIYPTDRIGPGEFWVLHRDDLRGIKLDNEDFSSSPSFNVTMMDYARLVNCKFDGANMDSCSFSRADVEKCSFRGAVLAQSRGFYTRFRGCEFQGACFLMAGFVEADFTGSNLQSAYFEDARIISPRVDYRTQFDEEITKSWGARSLPPSQLPDIYRFIRMAYESAEIYHRADAYLYKERKAFRRHALEPYIKENPSPRLMWNYFVTLLWEWSAGYGTKPFRILSFGPALLTIFALIYFVSDTPFAGKEYAPSLIESFYFSITSFATLGFGDLAFGIEHPWLRLISATEAVLGATWVAVFVAVLSRKLVR
jgi:hypothetical protein